ncbi:MAG: hypothetical protein GY710_13145 [Desulfobacteraceae bacterium]|nr:hypothetical protein [Desulfobacteraceae bacterium]
MDKKNIIKKYGKHDGNDHHRWVNAAEMAAENDYHVEICFKSLISLEDKGLIVLNEVEG